MRIHWKALIFCLILPFAVGGLASFLARDGIAAFGSLAQPSFTPPPWVFSVVWTVLYLMMGVASYRVVTAPVPRTDRSDAMGWYFLQLLLQFFWVIWFFAFSLYGFAAVWMVLLWLAILQTMRSFFSVDRLAGYLLLPYLFWVSFAFFLNLGVARLN